MYESGGAGGDGGKGQRGISSLDKIPKHGNVVLYCHLGIRSNAARAWIEAQGIPISHLNGGIEAWLFDQGF